MATPSYRFRIDPELRAQSEAIFGELGMSLDTAINIFLIKAVRIGGFPFDVRLDTPARETIEAMLETEKIAKDATIEPLNVDDALETLKR